MVLMLKLIPVLMIATAGALSGAEGLVVLVDPLDEPEQYCVDVPGFGRRLNLNAPLMAHTCKPGAPDELFMIDHPDRGQIYMKAYDRCVTAESDRPGSEVFLKQCGSTHLQRFSFRPDGRIELAGSKVCLTVADEDGTPTGGPSHLRRDLMLQSCGTAAASLSTWKVPESD